MKKRMKKMSTIALSLIMALNVCGFYCYADESAIDTCTSIEECTCQGIYTGSQGISLLSTSDFSSVPSNEVDHIIHSLYDEDVALK